MKVIYLNTKTGNQVQYGENITFQEEGTYSNGYQWKSTTTLPVINETIPMLIEKGVLVQKEVKESEVKDKPYAQLKATKKLDLIAVAISNLTNQIEELQKSVNSIFNKFNY